MSHVPAVSFVYFWRYICAQFSTLPTAWTVYEPMESQSLPLHLWRQSSYLVLARSSPNGSNRNQWLSKSVLMFHVYYSFHLPCPNTQVTVFIPVCPDFSILCLQESRLPQLSLGYLLVGECKNYSASMHHYSEGFKIFFSKVKIIVSIVLFILLLLW